MPSHPSCCFNQSLLVENSTCRSIRLSSYLVLSIIREQFFCDFHFPVKRQLVRHSSGSSFYYYCISYPHTSSPALLFDLFMSLPNLFLLFSLFSGFLMRIKFFFVPNSTSIVSSDFLCLSAAYLCTSHACLIILMHASVLGGGITYSLGPKM